MGSQESGTSCLPMVGWIAYTTKIEASLAGTIRWGRNARAAGQAILSVSGRGLGGCLGPAGQAIHVCSIGLVQKAI